MRCFNLVMLLRGFADAVMMRSQQVLASAGEAGFLPPHHYDQIFTAHGVIMIFFVAMPFLPAKSPMLMARVRWPSELRRIVLP